MKAVKQKRKYRSWKDVHDEFSDLPVSRQRKWQLRMRKEGRCGQCGRDFVNGRCAIHTSLYQHPHKWGVIGPCVANMIKAGMKVDEVCQAMNLKRNHLSYLLKYHGVDASNQYHKYGVIGPCVANMLRAGMTIPEIMEDMNMNRVDVLGTAYRYGVDISDQHLKPGRPRITDLNLRIFLKESLNGNDPAPLKGQSE